MSISPRLFEGIATGAAGLVAGGTMYITVVEAPARAKLTPPDQLKHWRTTFPPAAGLFKPASMILVPTLSAVGYMTEKPIYYAAAGAFGLLAPFTAAFIASTNKRLLTMKEPTDQESNQEIITLVSEWAKRHAIRVAFTTIGFGICLYAYSSPTRT